MHPPDFRLDHRLADWPDCHLELRCLPCGDRCTVPSVKLLRRQQGNPTFRELLGKLRCQECGAGPAPVYLCAGHHRRHMGGASPDWAIELVAGPRGRRHPPLLIERASWD